MRKKTGFISAIIVAQSLTSFSVYAMENGVYFGNGKNVLGYCDDKNPGALYMIMYADTLIAKGKSDQMGCLQAVLTGVKSCDGVILRIGNKTLAKDAKDERYLFMVPGPSCGSSNSQDKPSEPTQELADLDKVRKTAENKARQFANTVASNFKQGKSNYLYNFIVGYEAGLDAESNKSYYNKAFAEGQASGLKQGTESGYAQGAEAAVSIAEDKARKDVYGQISQSLDASKEVTPAPDQNIPAYAGASNSLGSLTLSNVMSSDDTRKMIAKKFSEAGFDLSDFQLNAVIERSMNLRHILSDLEPEWAYNSHLKSSDVSEYVEDLKRKGNATAALEAYETQFKDVYWSVIDDKVAKKIVQPQPLAQQSGYLTGLSLVTLVAQSQGKDAGYISAYKPASQKGFLATYPTVYGANFNAHVSRLDKSMEINSAQASLTDAKGGTQFVIGQPVNLAVGSVVNLGKISGSVAVSISGAMNAETTLHVKGRSRNKDQVVENVGRISPTASLGTQKVEIKIAGITISQNLEITWANQLNALTTVQDPQALEDLSSFIAGALLKEWKDVLNNKAVVQNQILYRDAKAYPKSLMGQFETLAAKLKAKNPQVVNQIGLKLQKIFFSMLTEASVQNYANTWLPKDANKDVFKKLYSDARTEVAADPILSTLAQGCVTDAAVKSCISSINIKTTDDYNKWSTGKGKVEAILKK